MIVLSIFGYPWLDQSVRHPNYTSTINIPTIVYNCVLRFRKFQKLIRVHRRRFVAYCAQRIPETRDGFTVDVGWFVCVFMCFRCPEVWAGWRALTTSRSSWRRSVISAPKWSNWRTWRANDKTTWKTNGGGLRLPPPDRCSSDPPCCYWLRRKWVIV